MANGVRKLRPIQLFLLAIPCVAVLIIPWFNKVEPRLFGFPFFYWWQLAWVPLSSVFIAIVYRMGMTSGNGD